MKLRPRMTGKYESSASITVHGTALLPTCTGHLPRLVMPLKPYVPGVVSLGMKPWLRAKLRDTYTWR